MWVTFFAAHDNEVMTGKVYTSGKAVQLLLLHACFDFVNIMEPSIMSALFKTAECAKHP